MEKTPEHPGPCCPAKARRLRGPRHRPEARRAAGRCALSGLPQRPSCAQTPRSRSARTILASLTTRPASPSACWRAVGPNAPVLTAVAVQHGCWRRCWRLQALSVSEVTFAPLTAEQIAAYVANWRAIGKAGVWHSGARGCVYSGAAWQLFGHHGPADVRDSPVAACHRLLGVRFNAYLPWPLSNKTF